VLGIGLSDAGGYLGQQIDQSDNEPYIPFSFNPSDIPFSFDPPPDGNVGDGDDDGGDGGGLPGFPFPFPLPEPDPDPFPLPGFPIPIPPGLPTYPGTPTDPNSLNGPAGYGTANFVTNMGYAFAYRVTFENDPKANAPAQIVTITDNLGSSLDWTTFQLTGIGFADNNFVIPPGSQHYQTTISMTYNGQTFNVQIETGIHTATGQVYATFESIDPNTSLPPSNVLTGFLPPEDGTGRGEGYLTYTVSPKSIVPNSTVINNVALITFDGNQPIATDQVDDDDASKGIDPTKEAPVTIDATTPTSHVTLPSHVGPSIAVSWSGSDVGGSGIATYTVYVSTDGGQTYTAWLTNTQQTSGVYQGTAGKTYFFYVVATNNVGTVQTNGQAGAVSTYVDFPPQVTSALTAQVMMGQPFSYQIAASNSPTSFGATGLPEGLTVSATNGLISGTPTETGVFSVGLSASNAGGTGTATLTLTVDAAPVTYPVITSATTATVVLGQALNYQIVATNDPTEYGASGLPDGVSINTTSGLISGAPTQTGVFKVGLSATNAGGTGTASLTLTVSPVPVVPPTITSVLTTSAEATVPFGYQIVATDMPSEYGAGGLPAGLSINAASGLISGAPTTEGAYQVTLSATNSGGTGTAILSLTVAAAPVVLPTITSATTADVLVGESLRYQITASHNPTLYGASGLPAGIIVDTSTGLISGTPSKTGIFSIGLSATNAGGTGTAALTLTVSPEPVVAPVITSVLAVNGQATVEFNYQITASNMPSVYDASGLPQGLSINTASGLISGTPIVAGVHSIVLSAYNSGGTGTATLTLTLAAAPLPVVRVAATIAEVRIGTGKVGEFTLSIAHPLKKPLMIKYALKGNAENGTDYHRLMGTKVIKAGQTKAIIKIVPEGDLEGKPEKTVRFVLESSKEYTIKPPPKPVKIEILNGH
jgi:hypothetical protein